MNRTKNAIIQAFWQLLEEKPYNKITVKDIVDSCQINRNTFYYHFHDIPELLEQTIKKDIDDIIHTCNNFSSPSDCLAPLAQHCITYQKAISHIYHSIHREVFLDGLNRICLYTVTRYIDTVAVKSALPPDDKKLLIRFYKSTLVGILLDWLNEGMNYDLLASFSRICELFADFDKQTFLKTTAPNG